MDIIKKAMEDGKNIVVAGRTGPGTTTKIDDIKMFYPSSRIVSIESCAELKITDTKMASIKTLVQ